MNIRIDISGIALIIFSIVAGFIWGASAGVYVCVSTIVVMLLEAYLS